MNKPVLELASIKKSFSKGSSNKIEVLKGVDLQLFPGEIVALVAPSGAGKSTLLQIAGLLDKPLSGKIFIDGQEIQSKSDNQLTMIRRREIGFVYQFHHLLPEFSSRENIDLPQLANGFPSKDAQRRSNELLDLVNLANRSNHRPAELSGGEQQRIAICRALANKPKIILADEPTGNLDQNTTLSVFESLLKIVKKTNLAALIATHNLDLAKRMDRVVELIDGKIS
ncbi:MAG: lipoprotein-releasing system ATP-binding protein LolD [Paracoccaceae bacterium]|jgi:lipoprotein-releasing system ATP-binding protein|nr:MAG: lipoprotein-releasing system ATP-binding protein LolD [Paracoccaceae bacterium]|tara:strand:- start:237 stop:914 length:678 start_codon:yes stop_codon:yes gene_type:complete